MIIVDLLKTASAVLAVLVFIIVSQKFIRVLAQAVDGSISNQTVMHLIGLKTILVTTAFLPTALFMAILMVLGRMYREQEIAAIASAGGGMLTIYRGVFWVLVPLSLFSGWLSLYAGPWAELQGQKLMHFDNETADIRSISAGRFSEYSGGELIFYTESVDDDGKMHHVFLQNKQSGKTGVVNAEYGRLDNLEGGLYLILEHGERILGAPGDKEFTIETFAEYAVLIEKKSSALVVGSHAVKSQQIWSSSNLQDMAEMQDRLSGPFSTIFLGFLAVPLAKLSPRGGVYGNLLVAFAIYFAYSNLQRVNHSWVVADKIPGWLGYFWADLLLLSLGLILLFRTYGWQWLLQHWQKGY
ncbi:LPS export ABC transporter permease LptF [Methylomonas paludis]|uniref:Lipopolysaccharide export system permease protein LptF n=1 Tax=Methylomonas paludis TaxID=1173101 RepID=A0A975MMU5_9GAMM|nr:LPS export ABC transporter permease LptF [Methylomonas paludis]QWF70786.1 LPS export ABC transporter permease LptF [Methylomonas paludis]